MVAREKGTLRCLNILPFAPVVGVTEELLSKPPCDLAIIRGPWPEKNPSILIPVRGGPSAEWRCDWECLSLKQTWMSFIFPRQRPSPEDEPFKGLEKYCNFPEVHFSRDHSDNRSIPF
jgi:hypothetical protein